MIKINMVKAKEIAHAARRVKRAEDFKPLDVQATIPTMKDDAEVARQIIRDEDAVVQAAMDKAKTPEKLKSLMVGAGLA